MSGCLRFLHVPRRCLCHAAERASPTPLPLHNAIFNTSPTRALYKRPANEPVRSYDVGSRARAKLEAAMSGFRAAAPLEIPLIIDGHAVRTGNLAPVAIPHDRHTVLAQCHMAGPEHVAAAIDSSLRAWQRWARTPFDDRMSIFLKAAAMLSEETWRSRICALTVLGQSKTARQAELDAACELIDFWRFNVHHAVEVADIQPSSPPDAWNRSAVRPLEGFIYASTPFNFTAIGANLPTAPAMLGNVVVWKPSNFSVVANYYTMLLLQEAGLPGGVINFIPGDPEPITAQLVRHPDLTGVHYTGSTHVLREIHRAIGQNIHGYKTFPRIVGETGGKGFVFAHASAAVDPLVAAIVQGAFEYAGQKCSAATRAYVPASLWPRLRDRLVQLVPRLKVGSPEEPDTFVNAVIHAEAFKRCRRYIEHARGSPEAEILVGGGCDDSKGYFVEPTVILTTNPAYQTMVEEIFGPIITVYVYPDAEYEKTLMLCDQTTGYALTGSIWARDREAIAVANSLLEYSAGTFYLNDKPTGAVVGQQPFGGSRLSGTNDKAGSHFHLVRWISPRTIKENFVANVEVLTKHGLEPTAD